MITLNFRNTKVVYPDGTDLEQIQKEATPIIYKLNETLDNIESRICRGSIQVPAASIIRLNEHENLLLVAARDKQSYLFYFDIYNKDVVTNRIPNHVFSCLALPEIIGELEHKSTLLSNPEYTKMIDRSILNRIDRATSHDTDIPSISHKVIHKESYDIEISD